MLGMKHPKDKLNLKMLSQRRINISYSFDNPFLAYSILRKLDVFEVVEDLPMANYSSAASGFKIQDHYCDKHRAYFARNPSIVFEEPKFITNYWKDDLLREQIIPKLGHDLHPEVDPRSRGIKYKFKIEFGLDANIFFTHDLFYNKRQIGKQFSCLSQASNHIPGHENIYKKDAMAQALVEYAKTYTARPNCFNYGKYFPKTWVLGYKDQCENFFRELNSVQYQNFKNVQGVVYTRTIGAGSHGNGAVYPLDNQEEEEIRLLYQDGKLCGQIQKGNIIQYNMLNPLLIENNKFSFRAFLLVASTNPIIAYYHDGYIKLALPENDPYSQEGNIPMKDESKRLRAVFQEETSKEITARKLQKDGLWIYENFNQYLLQRGMVQDPNWLNNQLRPDVKKAMIHLVKMTRSEFYKKSSVFELYSVDFKMDQNLDIWFSEANPMPLLNGATDEITELLSEMLVDTFDIVLGLLRSRTKRIINYINDLTEIVDGLDIPNLEERRREFRELTKNRFEPEFEPSPANTFQKIIDENGKGADKYSGLVQRECL